MKVRLCHLRPWLSSVFHPAASEEEREEVQAILSEQLAEQEDVLVAYLHGSFLETMYEDVDVAILFSDPPKGGDLLRRSLRLSEELTRLLEPGLEVDVQALNEAPLPFRFEALRKGRRLVTRDEQARVQHETETIRDFHDFQHHLEHYRREIHGAGA